MSKTTIFITLQHINIIYEIKYNNVDLVVAEQLNSLGTSPKKGIRKMLTFRTETKFMKTPAFVTV